MMMKRQCSKCEGQGAAVVMVSVKLSGEVEHEAHVRKPSETEVAEHWAGEENGLGKNL